ncbi:hypothetical protein [Gordonia sp. N1V]|uniref:hypothetical protein n=1 Tax=Gordonia sp. N1V TaxID=3034163 RepID=UPI0023E17FE2|nr:hypothetical protein [Gordonia sp. N1V]MDF3284970.1 hypothetical protein [Gordonia sp. N1V]
MAKDAELDRLKVAQDLAFQRKQDAYERQQSAWQRRSSARDAMNRAYESFERARSEQDRTWDHYQSVRSLNGPRIDSLNTQQENAYHSMKRAYDASSAAYERRDGASASSYAAEGRQHKEESQRCVAERRRLVEEIRSARSRHESQKPTFDRAKQEFESCKFAFTSAKSDHESAQNAFTRAKAHHETAAKEFRARLEYVKSESKKRNAYRRSLAERAGVPGRYIDNVWVSQKPDGSANIYFGGIGEPNGPGHGHYAVDRDGNVTYKRDPFDPHGTHNFTDNQQAYADIVGKEASSGGDFGFRCRFRGYDAYVESNINREGRDKIDIYYGPNGPFGPGHHHAVAHRESPFDFISDELR